MAAASDTTLLDALVAQEQQQQATAAGIDDGTLNSILDALQNQLRPDAPPPRPLELVIPISDVPMAAAPCVADIHEFRYRMTHLRKETFSRINHAIFSLASRLLAFSALLALLLCTTDANN